MGRRRGRRMSVARIAIRPAHRKARRAAGAGTARDSPGHRRGRRRISAGTPFVTSVVIVGAGLAGLRAAQTLRADGFDGELTVVGAEPHLPYDRPPLSKGVLLGEAVGCDIALPDAEQYAAIRATWLLDCHATGLRRGGVRVGDSTLKADGVVTATGARH